MDDVASEGHRDVDTDSKPEPDSMLGVVMLGERQHVSRYAARDQRATYPEP